MTIQLSRDLEQALADEARRRGTTTELLANAFLRERFVSPSDQAASGKGAKNLAGHVGTLRSNETADF